MHRYLFIYGVETSLRSHTNTRIFKNEGCEITLVFTENLEGASICKAHIVTEGDVALKVHDEVVSTLSEVLDAVSYITKSSTFTLRLETILKGSAGDLKREVFRQTSKTTRNGLFITDTSYESINEIIDKDFDANALRWLRYAYRARTITELFTYFWLCLECLIGEEKIEVTCPKCGDKREYSNIKKDTVREILIEYGYKPKEFIDVWKCRQKVFHGKTKLDTTFMKKLKIHADKLGVIIESILDEKLDPSHKIGVQSPVANEMIENINGFYEFETKDSQAEFAMDFPTDTQLDEFHYNPSVRDEEHGFELLNFEGRVNDW